MNTKTKKTLDAVAVFAILVILGLAAFASAESYIKLSDTSDTNREQNEQNNDGMSVSDRNGYFPRVESNNSMPFYYVSISLEPEKQVSDTGEAIYKVIVKDFHDSTEKRLYTYSVEFGSGQEVEGVLREKFLTLASGETKTLPLTVRAERKGTYVFKVELFDDSGIEVSSAKGLFVFDGQDEPNPYYPSVYFQGDGFVTNNAGQGALIDLHLLNKDGVISGKMIVQNEPRKVEGKLDGEEIEFRILTPDGEPQGYFEGTVREFKEFLLLEGNLIFDSNNEVWKLTAFSKRQAMFIEVVPTMVSEQPVETVAPLNGVVAIKPIEQTETSTEKVSQEPNKEIYVKPKEVKNDKFLWLIPTGRKTLTVEIIEGNEVTEKKFKEYTSTEVSGYEVSVGSLEDEENIEFSVKKTA